MIILYFNILGDSGGPLYFADTINEQDKYVVAGITSFGKDCAQVGLPGYNYIFLMK